jgi:hypothetical protein
MVSCAYDECQMVLCINRCASCSSRQRLGMYDASCVKLYTNSYSDISAAGVGLPCIGLSLAQLQCYSRLGLITPLPSAAAHCV